MKAWHPKNQTPFHPPDLAKNEGRGEQKYAHDLCLNGLDATHNTPGQNPDILIKDGPGREVKELDRNRRFRASASQDVMLALARNVVRPLFSLAEEELPELEFDLLTIGNVRARTLRLLLFKSGFDTRAFFERFFEHSNIDAVVLCYEDGYVEFDLDSFCDCFEIYKIDKFVATLRLREGIKIVPPERDNGQT